MVDVLEHDSYDLDNGDDERAEGNRTKMIPVGDNGSHLFIY